jgi:hypothetical protein
VPLLVDFDERLIDPVGVISYLTLGPATLVEFRSIALDPSKDRRMINHHPTLLHQLFHIPIAESVAQIPPHGTEHDVGLKVAPFEEQGRSWPIFSNLGKQWTDP